MKILISVLTLILITACEGGGHSDGSSPQDPVNGKDQSVALTLSENEKAQVLNSNGLEAEAVLASISDLVAQRNNAGEKLSLDALSEALEAEFSIECRITVQSSGSQICTIQEREKKNVSN